MGTYYSKEEMDIRERKSRGIYCGSIRAEDIKILDTLRLKEVIKWAEQELLDRRINISGTHNSQGNGIRNYPEGSFEHMANSEKLKIERKLDI